MSFPTTSVLDAFDRANGAVGASWTTPIWFDATAMTINTNRVTWDPSFGGGYWNASTFGPDSEVYVSVPTQAGGLRLMLRVASPGASCNGYSMQAQLGADNVRIARVDGGVDTQLGADIPVSPSFSTTTATAAGFGAIGSTLTMYRILSGVWSSVDSRTDSTYSAVGYIGMLANQPSQFGDDFGGGTVVVAPTVATATRGTFDPELLPTELFDREML